MNDPATLRRRRLSAVALMGLVACLVTVSTHSPAKDEPQPAQQIQADDITSRRIQIIGRLGHPLGEMITIRGRWKRPGPRVKDPAFHFVVTEVDGKKLATSVDFHDRGVSLPGEATSESLVDKVCELRGYEGASFWGDPGRFHRELAGLEGDGESPVADPWGFKFMPEFHTAVLKVIDQSIEAAHAKADRNVPQRITQIQAADLTAKRVQIIGRLGHPLGEMLTICGEWQVRKAGSKVPEGATEVAFCVTHVDGKPLDVPVDFHRDHVLLPQKMTAESLEAKLCELRGYERGSFWGAPRRFHRELAGLKGDGKSPVQDTYGFKFVTEFHTAKIKVGDGTRQSPAAAKSAGRQPNP